MTNTIIPPNTPLSIIIFDVLNLLPNKIIISGGIVCVLKFIKYKDNVFSIDYELDEINTASVLMNKYSVSVTNTGMFWNNPFNDNQNENVLAYCKIDLSDNVTSTIINLITFIDNLIEITTDDRVTLSLDITNRFSVIKDKLSALLQYDN